MSSSIVPKSIRNIFKRHKKKNHNQDDNTDVNTVDSYTADNPDQLQQAYMEAGDDYNLPLAIAMSESARDAQGQTLEAAESGSSIRYMASYSNGYSNHSEALSSAYYFHGMYAACVFAV